MDDLFADFDARLAQTLDELERTRRRYLDLLEELESLQAERERLRSFVEKVPAMVVPPVPAPDRAVPA